jgi:dihydrofolate reductase
MTLSHIVAVSANDVIGVNNTLPWDIPEDMKFFREKTKGRALIMGRKTFESILKRLGKPLPGRKNVVITRQTDYRAAEGVLVFHSLEEVAQALAQEDLYIIGGAEIFKLALPLAREMYITHVKGDYEGDAFFPQIAWDEWEKIQEDPHEKFTFAKYKKRSS